MLVVMRFAFLVAVATMSMTLTIGARMSSAKSVHLVPPEGYPPFLPLLAGGTRDAALSSAKTVVLRYAEPDPAVARKLRELLKREGFTFSDDNIPGMKGTRFVATKGPNSAYFTVKPDYGKPETILIVTDTTGAK